MNICVYKHLTECPFIKVEGAVCTVYFLRANYIIKNLQVDSICRVNYLITSLINQLLSLEAENTG